MRVFENVVLRKTIGREREEVTVDRRKVHNGKLYDV
jgi:hypothetical protein